MSDNEKSLVSYRLHETFTSSRYDLTFRRRPQEDQLRRIGMIGPALAMLALPLLSACGSEEAAQPVAMDTIEALEARVAGDAVMLMDRESFGDTYAKLGAGQFQSANELMQWAAIAAVAQGNACDRVAMVNVSDRSTRDNIIWFVDCDNTARVFIEQRQAEDAKQRFDNATSEVEQG